MDLIEMFQFIYFIKKDHETKRSINHRLNCNFYTNYQYLIFL